MIFILVMSVLAVLGTITPTVILSLNQELKNNPSLPSTNVSIIAGNGTYGSGSSVSFNYPNGVAVDFSGNVYVATTKSEKYLQVAS